MDIRKNRLRRTGTTVALGVTAVAVIGLSSLAGTEQANAESTHTAAIHAATVQVSAAQTLAGKAAVDSVATMSAADNAKGEVLDQAVLTTANKDVIGLTIDRATLLQVTKQAQQAIAGNAGGHIAYWNLGTLDAALDRVDLSRQLSALRAADRAAVADQNALASAVTAWKAEQARVTAQKAAAARAAADKAAAAQAAARAATPRTHPSTPSTSQAAGAPAPATDPGTESKLAIAQATFARYGFTNVVYNSGASQGHYAATDMSAGVIYVQLTLIPTDRVASVCLHEYQHILQGREYGGYAGAVAHYGSVLAMEKAADEGAIAAGATWTDYVG